MKNIRKTSSIFDNIYNSFTLFILKYRISAEIHFPTMDILYSFVYRTHPVDFCSFKSRVNARKIRSLTMPINDKNVSDFSSRFRMTSIYRNATR